MVAGLASAAHATARATARWNISKPVRAVTQRRRGRRRDPPRTSTAQAPAGRATHLQARAAASSFDPSKHCAQPDRPHPASCSRPSVPGGPVSLDVGRMAPWTALIVQALVGGIVFWGGSLAMARDLRNRVAIRLVRATASRITSLHWVRVRGLVLASTVSHSCACPKSGDCGGARTRTRRLRAGAREGLIGRDES